MDIETSVLIGFLILFIVISLLKKDKSTKTQSPKGYPEGVKYVKRADLTDKDIQENAFIIALGPDDFKVSFGYDFMREQTYFTIAMGRIEIMETRCLYQLVRF